MSSSLAVLPIDAYLPQLIAAVKSHDVVIVNGPPGCGKSTRIMPALLSALSREWTIFQTQPRPMLIRSAALRILDEHRTLGWRPGLPVGYIAGADRHVFPATQGIILSDQGMVNRLTTMAIEDPTIIMVDEAHLPSSQTHVLLGMLNILLKIHAGLLKIIISSATAEVGKMAKFFGGAEVINVTGRLFPVTRRLFSSHDPIAMVAGQLTQNALDFFRGTYVVEGPEIPRLVVTQGAVAGLVSGEDDVEYVASTIIDAVLVEADLLSEDNEVTAWVETVPGGELITLPGKTIEILKDYRAFDDRIEAEERMRREVPANCLRVIVGTEIIGTGVTMKNLVEFHDSGLVKRLEDDRGAGKLVVQLVSQAEIAQALGRLGRVCPGRYNLYLPVGKTIADLSAYPESELRKQPLTRTVLTIRSAGYDPSTFPFLEKVDERLDPSLPTFTERLEAADRRLIALGAVSSQGTVTRLGEWLRGIRARPELAVTVRRGQELHVAAETLIAGVAAEPGTSPFFHTKKDLKNVPFTTCEEVVRLILSRCDVAEDVGGKLWVYYTRDREVTPPAQVSLDRLPPWIERQSNGLYKVHFVSEGGKDHLTDRGRHELALLVRRSYAGSTGSDFVAIVNACRAFAMYRRELKEQDEAKAKTPVMSDTEDVERERRRKLKEWCEHRFLNFPNLQVIWRRINEAALDLRRAGTEFPKEIADGRDFSSDALTQALLPLFEAHSAVRNTDGTSYTMGQHVVEPGWQSALRQFYPLPPFALFADVRQSERRGDLCYFAEFSAPIALDWLLKTNPERWQLVTRGTRTAATKKLEDMSVIDTERHQEVYRFEREQALVS